VELTAGLAIHGWDHARATGQDDALVPGAVAMLLPWADRHHLPRAAPCVHGRIGLMYALGLLYFAALQQARDCYAVPKKASSAYWSE
jgi:hypothetical protein